MRFHKRVGLSARILIVLFLAVNVGFRNTAVGSPSQRETSHIPAAPSMSKLNEYLLIAQLPDGRLMGVLDRMIDGVPEAAARFSSDNGHSWSEISTLFKLPKELGRWTLYNVLLDHNGEIHVFYANDAAGSAKTPQESRNDIWHAKSIDGRKNWQAPRPVRKGFLGSILSVIELPSGRILLPFCYLTSRTWSNRGEGFDAFAYMGGFNSSVLYSDDGGDSWHQSDAEFKAATPTIGENGLIEPVALQLKNGRVWILIRTQLGRFFESFSEDGSAWSPPQPTRILSSDSPAGLVRLEDGRIVMLWNNCLRFCYANGGRHLLHAAISDDEGKTWHGYREVARNPLVHLPPPPTGDHGASYPVPILTKDGKVVTPLSMGMEDGMYLLRIDPSWLYETSRKTDFSAGIDDWSVFGTKGIELAPHPEKRGAQVLSIRKTRPDWPAGAVWNFPMGVKGQLRMKILLKPGLVGALVGITDHFSVPFDQLAQFYNLYNFEIGPNGDLANEEKIEPGRWHNLQFDWNCATRECRVLLDDRQVTVLPLLRESEGASYLRLRATAEKTDDAGFLVESVEADVSN